MVTNSMTPIRGLTTSVITYLLNPRALNPNRRCLFLCRSTDIYACANVRIYIYTHTITHASTYVHLYIYTRDIYIYIHVYINIYIYIHVDIPITLFKGPHSLLIESFEPLSKVRVQIQSSTSALRVCATYSCTRHPKLG